MPEKPHIWYCSFCGASQYERAKLYAGPVHTAICNDCVYAAFNIMRGGDAARVMIEGDLWAEVEHFWFPLGTEEADAC